MFDIFYKKKNISNVYIVSKCFDISKESKL